MFVRFLLPLNKKLTIFRLLIHKMRGREKDTKRDIVCDDEEQLMEDRGAPLSAQHVLQSYMHGG